MERASVEVLKRAIEIQRKKSQDYQNPKSTVKQADYYPSGIQTIYEIMHGKMLRIKSLLESEEDPNFESLEDSFVDLINYASFGAAWLRGGIPGQSPTRDIFNKEFSGVRKTGLDPDAQLKMNGITVAAQQSSRR